MATTAGVGIVCVLLFSVQQILAFDCVTDLSTLSCQDCIRGCGGYWCSNPGAGSTRCTMNPSTNCTENDREPKNVPTIRTPGDVITPVYVRENSRAGRATKITIEYKSSTPLEIPNPVGDERVSWSIPQPYCSNGNCTVNVTATPGADFCEEPGLPDTLTYQLMVGYQKVQIELRVPCDCGCAAEVEGRSEICHGNGDFSCGTCKCSGSWRGEHCDSRCVDRGDTPLSCKDMTDGKICSGNGHCGECDTCVCDTQKPGSKYFKKENNCAGLCYSIEYEDESCILELSKPCENVLVIPENRTILEESSRSGVEWVYCNYADSECPIKYAAMMVGSQKTVMVLEHCDMIVAAATGTPKGVVTGVLVLAGLIVASAAVAGYIWYTRPRGDRLHNLDIDNIAADDATGVNPLYRDPNSTYRNPTYGKW